MDSGWLYQPFASGPRALIPEMTGGVPSFFTVAVVLKPVLEVPKLRLAAARIVNARPASQRYGPSPEGEDGSGSRSAAARSCRGASLSVMTGALCCLRCTTRRCRLCVAFVERCTVVLGTV